MHPDTTAMDGPGAAGALTPLAVPSARLGTVLRGHVWTAHGLAAGEAAPWLLVHDGPAYLTEAGLARWLAQAVAAGTLPPLRAALLGTDARHHHYAALDAYADALVAEVIPALEALAPAPGRHARVAVGASLGALAALHAHRRHPGVLGALVLASGSFFRHHLDSQESAFHAFDRIDAFVARVSSDGAWRDPIPVVVTCGAREENLANNRALAAALAAQRYPITVHEVDDGGHTWDCFRRGLDAALAPLATALCAPRR